MTLRAAQATGFAVARQGEAAISEAFRCLADAADGMGQEPDAAFGNLLAQLRHDYRLDPEFEPFRRILRGCILLMWLIAAGEMVLGEVQTERRLHSLYSAARELGTTEELLEPFLVEAGALDPADPHYANRRVFPVADFASLLAEIPTLVNLATLRADLGVSRNEIKAMVAQGILVPRCRSDIVRLRWSDAQAKAFCRT